MAFEVGQPQGVLAVLPQPWKKSKGNAWRPSAIGLAGPLLLDGVSSLIPTSIHSFSNELALQPKPPH